MAENKGEKKNQKLEKSKKKKGLIILEIKHGISYVKNGSICMLQAISDNHILCFFSC